MITIFVTVPALGYKSFQIQNGHEHGPKIIFPHQATVMRLVRTLTVDAGIPVRVVVRNWRGIDKVIIVNAGDSPVTRSAVRMAITDASTTRNDKRRGAGITDAMDREMEAT